MPVYMKADDKRYYQSNKLQGRAFQFIFATESNQAVFFKYISN